VLALQVVEATGGSKVFKGEKRGVRRYTAAGLRYNALTLHSPIREGLKTKWFF
jgi:hypothetical protein